MAETAKKAEAKPAAAAPLGRAGESGDPAVHQLLAHLEISRANGDQEAVDAYTRQLAELGYE